MKHLPEREDVLAGGRAPIHVRKFLIQIGGLNPYDEPNLRLVLSDHVMILIGNAWEDREKGQTGGMEFSETKVRRKFVTKSPDGTVIQTTVEMPEEMRVKDDKPVRVVREMRLVRRYPTLKGWLLQHWEPAGYGGADRTWWEQQTVPGAEGLLALGPFPEKGTYENFMEWMDPQTGLSVPCWMSIPPLDRIELGYQMMIRGRSESVSANPAWRRLTKLTEWQNRQIAKQQKEDADNAAILKDQLTPIFASSLEGARVREHLAGRLRARGIELGHVGA